MTAAIPFKRIALIGLTTLSFGAMASVAQAQAEVSFVKPENFSDIGFNSSDRTTAMKQLEDHFKALAARELPGKQLKIEVTDVDLAGELEPSARIDRLRILREMPWWIRNVFLKVLLRLRLRPVARLFGHDSPYDPY